MLAQNQGEDCNENEHTDPQRHQHQRLVEHLSRQTRVFISHRSICQQSEPFRLAAFGNSPMTNVIVVRWRWARRPPQGDAEPTMRATA